MKIFNGTFALLGGFVGVVGLGFAIYNRTLDVVGALLFGALIIIGLIAVWQRVSGRADNENTRPKGPLSRKKKAK